MLTPRLPDRLSPSIRFRSRDGICVDTGMRCTAVLKDLQEGRISGADVTRSVIAVAKEMNVDLTRLGKHRQAAVPCRTCLSAYAWGEQGRSTDERNEFTLNDLCCVGGEAGLDIIARGRTLCEGLSCRCAHVVVSALLGSAG